MKSKSVLKREAVQKGEPMPQDTVVSESPSVVGYLCEDEIYDLVDDMEELREYLNGWEDAIKTNDGKTFYKKEYVDMFVNR